MTLNNSTQPNNNSFLQKCWKIASSPTTLTLIGCAALGAFYYLDGSSNISISHRELSTRNPTIEKRGPMCNFNLSRGNECGEQDHFFHSPESFLKDGISIDQINHFAMEVSRQGDAVSESELIAFFSEESFTTKNDYSFSSELLEDHLEKLVACYQLRDLQGKRIFSSVFDIYRYLLEPPSYWQRFFHRKIFESHAIQKKISELSILIDEGYSSTQINRYHQNKQLSNAFLPSRLQMAKKRLQHLNPKELNLDTELCSEWEQLSKKTRELLSAMISAFSSNSKIISSLEKLEKSIERLEETIKSIAASVRPLQVLRKITESPPFQEIDDRLYQHILGDYWGKGTGLEGYPSGKMLSYILGMLHMQIDALEKNPLCSDKDRIALCKTLFGIENADINIYRALQRQMKNAITITDAYSQDNRTFFRTLKNAMDQLAPNESFFFLGGWTNKYYTNGHAIVYEMVKQTDNRFTLRIFNRGAGINYHVKRIIHHQERALPFLEIADIPYQNLACRSFAKALKELNSRPPSGSHEQTSEEFSEDDLYGSLIPSLEGNPRTLFKSYPAQEAMEVLNVGHCSYLSINGYLHHHLGASHHRFILDMQFKTLWDYYNQVKKDLSKNALQRKILSKGCKQLARNARQALRRKLLGLAESNFIQEHLKEVESAIQSSKDPHYALQAMGIESPQPILKLHPILTQHLIDKTASNVSFEALDGFSFKPNLMTFIEDCKQWRLHFAKGNGLSQHAMVKAAIKDWICQLPVEWLDNPASLDQLFPSDAEEAVFQLAELAKDFLWTHKQLMGVEPDRLGYVEPSDFFSMIKLLTLADAIAKKYPDITQANLPGLYQHDMDLLFESFGYVPLFDPKQEDQLLSLKSYWDRTDPIGERKKREHLSFFGLEAHPMTTGCDSKIDIHVETSPSAQPTFPWPFMQWAENYLKRPEIVQKIAILNPELSNQSSAYQAVAAQYHIESSDGSTHESMQKLTRIIREKFTRFLPPTFYALRDLSLSLNTLMHPGQSDVRGYRPERDFSFEARLAYDYYNSVHFFGTSFRSGSFGLCPISEIDDAVFRQYWTAHKGNSVGSNPTDFNRFLERGQDSIKRLRKIYGKNHWVFPFDIRGKSRDRRRLGPHLRTFFPAEIFQGTIDSETVKDLLSLSGVRELQTVETLGFFKTKLPLFTIQEYRKLFMMLMTEPPLLLEQIKNGDESFVKELNSFIKKGYQFYEDLNDLETSGYFLDLNRYFSSTVRYVEGQKGIAFSGIDFLDTRAELRRRLKEKKLSLKEKCAIWIDIAATIDPSLFNADDAADLLSAYALNHFSSLQQGDPFYSRSKETLLRDRLSHFQGKLQKLLQAPEMDSILNTVLQRVFPKAGLQIWKKTSVFPCFTTENGAYTIDVSNGKIYQKGHETSSLPMKLRDVAKLKPFIKDSLTLQVQEKAPNYYEWMDSNGRGIRVFDDRSSATFVIQREVEPNVWAEQVDIEELPGGILLHQTNKKRITWAEIDPLSDQRIWISDPTSGELLYRIDRGQILNLDPSKPWVAFLPAHSSTLSAMDDNGMVLIWTDPISNTHKEIELARYHLFFPIEENQIHVPDFPGFFISSDPFHPLAHHYSHRIVLENALGKKKILLLNPFYSTNEVFQKAEKKFFTFDAASSLQPLQSEDWLYLALVELEQEEFDAARASLNKFRSPLRPLNPQEIALLKEVIDHNNFAPEALALRMEALFLIARNHLDFNGPRYPSEKKPPLVNEILWAYEQFIDQIPIRFRLKKTEETWLFFNYWPVIFPTHFLNHHWGLLQGASLNTESESDSLRFSQLQLESEIEKPYHSYRTCFLLRSEGQLNHFARLYELARQDPDINNYRHLFWALIDKSIDAPMSINELKFEIQRALTIIAVSRSNQHERLASAILLAVLENPSRFPETLPYNALSDYKSYLLQPARATLERLNQLILPNEQKLESEPSRPAELEASAPLCEPTEYPLLLNRPLEIPSLNAQAATISKTSDELIKLFARPIADPSLSRSFAALANRLKSFSPNATSSFRLNDQQELYQQKELLRKDIENHQLAISNMEQKLLSLANKEPSDPEERLQRRLNILGGHELPLSIQDLALAFLQSNPRAIERLNPALSCEEAQKLMIDIQQLMIDSIRYQQELRLLDSMQLIEKIIKNPASSENELSLALDEMASIATANRSYNINEHPEYLVFEYATKIMLRQKQIEGLQEFNGGGEVNTALELIMGSGKTAVFTPLLALRRADGSTFSMLVMPEALLPSVSEMLRDCLDEAFSQAIELFHFDRNTALDRAALERILDRMQNTIHERKAALISSSSLQSFVLRFMETIQQNKQKEIVLFQKIFSLIRQSGAINLDEMDFLLDILKSHHFTQNAPLKMPEDLLGAVTHVYRTIAKRLDLQNVLNWNFLGNNGSPLTYDSFKKFQPLFVEELLKPATELDCEINRFLSSLNREQKDLLKAYLLQSKNPSAAKFVQEISNQIVKNTLAVWKEEASRLLLLTGRKNLGEHYGVNPQDRFGMAIPYHGSNNPMLGSQHGTDLEIINYTIQMYLSLGIPIEIIQEEIERLKETSLREMQNNPRIGIEQTQSYRDFLRLAGGRESLRLFSLSSSEISGIHYHVNENPSLKLRLIHRYILPKIPRYSRQIHTNTHIFEVLVKNLSGFSGTLWNADSFPHSYRRFILSDTEEKTLQLLWGHCPVSIIPQKASLREQIDALYATHRGSFIDLSGMFRNTDSETVASAVINLPIWRNTKIKGIVYYDAQGQKRAWVREKNQSVAHDQSHLEKEETIAYWEQKFTTGSDIQLSLDMTAIITIGQHTIMRDFLQGVWRLRQLHRGQSVSIAILPEDFQIMEEVLKTIGYDMQNPPTFSDVLFYLKYNEAQRQGDDNLRALRFKLNGVLIDRLWTSLLDEPGSVEKYNKAIEELFFQELSPNAFDAYGQIEETASQEEVIADELQRLKNSEAFALFSDRQEQILSQWHQIIAEERPKLPLFASRVARYETETEVQNEVEKQIERKNELQTEQQREMQFASDIPERWVFLWKEKDLFKENYFNPSPMAQQPEKEKFPNGALALPDFETLKQIPHPMDHLEIDGEDALAKVGIRPLSPVSNLSDPNLLESWNCIPNQKTQLALVIEDRHSGAIQLMRLSQWDALMFSRLLQKDREKRLIGSRDHRLALYDLDLGIFSQGSDPISPHLLEENRDFIRLKAQAKFFNGETQYSSEEIEILEKWIREAGPAKLKNLFINIILGNKPKSVSLYPSSPLAGIFERILQSIDTVA